MKKVPILNIVFFLLTVLSTLFVGAIYAGVDPTRDFRLLLEGLPFSATLMTILLCHEFGHYFASRRHNIKATLPFFIPLPFPPFGTLGAFIKMKSPIVTRKALIDIGASGPIAGFVVSIAAAIYGLGMSETGVAPDLAGGFAYVFGESLLFRGLSRLVLGTIPEGYDVFLHPVALAAWIGFFVTFLNLMPVGQLDGGHIAYALFGRHHRTISRALIVAMLVAGFLFTPAWWPWAVLLVFVLGLNHPPVMHWEPRLSPKRRLIGWVSLAIFILTFMPVPIKMVSGH